MSRQDKATTERFTRTLRELVKRPENKVCADCKRNDPRWASWNLGVFLCIRCSGIHRGMGTHISKVKSVDLDVWTPEQMESIQKWGNRRANLYWEAHLKTGHVPPEHKMESFIRSKYESRRWALEGQLPSDPSVLEEGAVQESSAVSSAQPPASPAAPLASATHATQTSTSSISNRHTLLTNRQPQAHQLLSSAYTTRQPTHTPPPAAVASIQPQAPQQQQQPTTPQNDLFSLDFHAPSPAVASSSPPPPVKKDVKQDILSLFSSPPMNANSTTSFNQHTASGSLWGGVQTQPQPQSTSMMGTNGTGVWGANSGWNTTASAPPSQGMGWGTTTAPAPQQQQSGLFNTDEIWKGSESSSTANATQDLFSNPFSTTIPTQKKDDVFGDLWGGFK